MGIFLQTVILPNATEYSARKAVEWALDRRGEEMTSVSCRQAGGVFGIQIFFDGEKPDFSEPAENLSKALKGPVLLAYLYDGEFWGYDLYDSGRKADQYVGRPDCFCEAAGKPEVLADYFSIQPDDIRSYLVPWTKELLEEERKAYPEDRYPYGDCRQLTDFLARLGWPMENGEPAAPAPVPALAEILSRNLPPFPMENPKIPAWDADTYYHTGNLPTALDRDYVCRLLRQEDLQYLADKTPHEIVEVFQASQIAVKDKTDPRLAVVSAFCKYWLGQAVGAFWDLYAAVNNDPDNIYLRRGRGLMVALFAKRHIAIRDMTRLMELDPENRDVYLLCRAFFYYLDRRKAALSAADLAELKQLGIPGRDDPRVFWAGFPQNFLLRLTA